MNTVDRNVEQPTRPGTQREVRLTEHQRYRSQQHRATNEARKDWKVVLTTRDNTVDPDQTSANSAWPQAGYMSGNHSDLTHTQESKLPHSVKSSSVADTHAEFADTHLTMTSTEVTS